MRISKISARQIVAQLSEVMPNHINMMDEHGVIVASTDQTRVGQLHGGAQKLLEEKLDKLFVHYDNEFPGVKMGLNLSIVQDDEIVGVIGITGAESEVFRYGGIIKKMSEILLKESDVAEQKRLDELNRRRLIEKWVGKSNISQSSDFIDWAAGCGIDVSIPRRVLVLDTHQAGRSGQDDSYKLLLEKIDNVIAEKLRPWPDAVMSRVNSQLCCLVPLRTDKEMLELARVMHSAVLENSGISLCAGIDEKVEDTASSYNKAQKAFNAAARSLDAPIIKYIDIDLDIFLNEISMENRSLYRHRIFGGLESKDLEEYIPLISCYFRNNGSIEKTAAALYMHKNTLQYKLKKFFNITGYDIRNVNDAVRVYLALLLV